MDLTGYYWTIILFDTHCPLLYCLMKHLRNMPEPTKEDCAFAPDYSLGSSTLNGVDASQNILMTEEQRSASGPLLHNDDEILAIADMVATSAFTGVAADERAFKSVLEHQGVLHLAMHAYSSGETERSGLVFRTPNHPTEEVRSGEFPGAEDGVFHSYELLTRKLNTGLLILSACETGYGEIESGEGVRSIARSFMLAGARNTISSLWKVDDLATKEIMVKFYEFLAEGMGKADALAEAKRWYRRTYPNEPPSKWAAFILIGDNEPVHLKKRSPVKPWMVGGAIAAAAAAVVLARRRRRMAA
ncbi:MAG: CHAT domain-containing protein [Flavobacteriales bacterium]